MTDSWAEHVARRARAANLVLPEELADACGRYLALLARWNRRINLTALPLNGPVPDASIDKLVIEPLVAAKFVPVTVDVWFDLGTGGGSPAIPIRIVRPGGSLTMVEARERKCAFLREVTRELRLARTSTASVRFDALAKVRSASLVTIRAVRIDPFLVDVIAGLTATAARVLSFGGAIEDRRFRLEASECLPDGSELCLMRRLD